jgi:hypothetical protein
MGRLVGGSWIALTNPTGYIWLPPMIFETTVFLFTIFKLYQKAIETNQMGSNLLVILYRDGVCYYFVSIPCHSRRFTPTDPAL